jgi:Rod binding domain-containing protein
MPITPIVAPSRGADLPLAQLAANSALSHAEKLAQVSRQFEAVLVRQILNEAQKPVFKSQGPGSAVCNDVYRDLMTSELAHQITRSGLGLARALEQQLQRQLTPAAHEPAQSAK